MTQPGTAQQAAASPTIKSPQQWLEEIRVHLKACQKDPLRLALAALQEHPLDGDLLLAAALAALIEERPEQSLRFQKRLLKRFLFDGPDILLLQALTWAQQGRWGQAARLLEESGLRELSNVSRHFRVLGAVLPWIRDWFRRIDQENWAAQTATRQPSSTLHSTRNQNGKAAPAVPVPAPHEHAPEEALSTEPAPAPQLSVRIPISFSLPNLESLFLQHERVEEGPEWFRLRSEFAHLSLLQGFDELLCLPLLHHVETYWYQVETARKVLKQFRGRVLLADEVGLGKTIEAGMVLKEYLLRGMVERVLVLTPASMVGQWLEELSTKFDISFASTYDSQLRNNPAAFWKQPRIVASIATARRAEHFALLAEQVYDLVIVDEAHHLRNRRSLNWKLVNELKKRFLLLLSATPVQNSLVELYNLLTLLKPGIFKTEKEFAATYMTPGKPRVPANQGRMRDLMRDVMVRNTRALVDVRLPRRHASKLQLDAGAEEAACYQDLSNLVRESYPRAAPPLRMALRHLQTAGGSSPAAISKAIERMRENFPDRLQWEVLRQRCLASGSCKEAALVELLKRNPEEKKIVFVHHRETLERLKSRMAFEGLECVLFEGSLSGPEKDRVIERFRDAVPLLLSTESGGEGRNLQFCNTLINFDLPWNPMAIEQRIGRVHRIGQTREVFIFNLVVKNTLEEHILRILDEKINMFELVVGEIGAILGEMEDTQDFAEMVFAAWVEASEQEQSAVFDRLGDQAVKALQRYESAKALDEKLFAEEFATS
jgi:superfamily II DNA or RNA helicase